MNLGLSCLVTLFMAVSLSACATVGSTSAGTAAEQPAGVAAPADAQAPGKSEPSAEPDCD